MPGPTQPPSTAPEYSHLTTDSLAHTTKLSFIDSSPRFILSHPISLSLSFSPPSSTAVSSPCNKIKLYVIMKFTYIKYIKIYKEIIHNHMVSESLNYLCLHLSTKQMLRLPVTDIFSLQNKVDEIGFLLYGFPPACRIAHISMLGQWRKVELHCMDHFLGTTLTRKEVSCARSHNVLL